MKLWSLRWSTARGYTWKMERSVLPDTADKWLALFKNDEPSVQFALSDKRPAWFNEPGTLG